MNTTANRNARHVLWGRNIRHGRLAMKLTQKQLAEILNVEQQSVSYWESGVWAPRDDKKLEIAKVLNQEVRFLFPLVEAAAS